MREKLLALEVTEIIASAQAMTDTQKHPLVADLEHVGAGSVFAFGDAQIFWEVGMKQLTKELPLLEI